MLTRNASWPGPHHGIRIQPQPKLTRGEQLLSDIESFRHRHKMKLTVFSLESGVQRRLIDRLRAGLNPSEETEAKVRAYMRRKEA